MIDGGKGTGSSSFSLLVTIDTEEENLWGGKFRAEGNTTRNLRGLPRFQALCEQYAIRPTYLIDAPVVSDSWAVEQLAAWQDSQACEVAAHCHPWCNPPLTGDVTGANSFLCRLAASEQRAKLEWLTNAIETRLGRRPTSFRAGRYGLDSCGAQILVDLGYSVDSSVIPFTDYSASGGPDFDKAPHLPYFVQDDLCSPADEGPLLEVPVTVGYSRQRFEWAHSIRKFAGRPPWRNLRMTGILDRTGLVRRIKLSPEQASASDQRRLIDLYERRSAPCVVLMFHSSSLMVGGSPYVPDEQALERFYSRLEAVFRYCVVTKAMATPSLSEFGCEYRSRIAPTAPEITPPAKAFG